VATGTGITPGGRSFPSPPNVHGDSTPNSNPPLTMAFGTSVVVTVCVIVDAGSVTVDTDVIVEVTDMMSEINSVEVMYSVEGAAAKSDMTVNERSTSTATELVSVSVLVSVSTIVTFR
jgi:hypothetical protein